jgi:hypothetical protein
LARSNHSKSSLTIARWKAIRAKGDVHSDPQVLTELCAVRDAWRTLEPGSTFVRLDIPHLLDFCLPNYERQPRQRYQAFVFETPLVNLIWREKERRNSGHKLRGSAQSYYDHGNRLVPIFTLDLEEYLGPYDSEGDEPVIQVAPVLKKEARVHKFRDAPRHSVICESVADENNLEEHCKHMVRQGQKPPQHWQCSLSYVDAFKLPLWRRRIRKEIETHRQRCPSCEKRRKPKAHQSVSLRS